MSRVFKFGSFLASVAYSAVNWVGTESEVKKSIDDILKGLGEKPTKEQVEENKKGLKMDAKTPGFEDFANAQAELGAVEEAINELRQEIRSMFKEQATSDENPLAMVDSDVADVQGTPKGIFLYGPLLYKGVAELVKTLSERVVESKKKLLTAQEKLKAAKVPEDQLEASTASDSAIMEASIGLETSANLLAVAIKHMRLLYEANASYIRHELHKDLDAAPEKTPQHEAAEQKLASFNTFMDSIQKEHKKVEAKIERATQSMAAAPAKKTNWILIAGIAAALIALGGAVYFLVMNRKTPDAPAGADAPQTAPLLNSAN